MSYLQVNNVSKSFEKTPVIQNLSLEVEQGEIVVLLGESGCGKSTLLRLICGFETIDGGEIVLNNTVLDANDRFIQPEKRNVGMVFQDYALFPHLNVNKNIAFGISKTEKGNTSSKVNSLAALFEIEDLLKKYPHELSGGQQRRVAIARSLAASPDILLLDEPFSNLDNLLKQKIRLELRDKLKQLNITTILVTHDLKDAVAVSDKIALMNNGNILQYGTKKELKENPAAKYVSLFFDAAST